MSKDCKCCSELTWIQDKAFYVFAVFVFLFGIMIYLSKGYYE